MGWYLPTIKVFLYINVFFLFNKQSVPKSFVVCLFVLDGAKWLMFFIYLFIFNSVYLFY